MQTIIFGDSITFGFEAPGTQRDHTKRWSYQLVLNNPEHDIVIDGWCGRSFKGVKKEHIGTGFDGKDDIVRCLERNWNSDRLIVMLGGNDLFHGGVRSEKLMREHITEFLEVVRKRTEWKKDRFEIILVSPPGWTPGTDKEKRFIEEFEGNFHKAFEGHGVKFLNISNEVVSPPKGKPNTDGAHLTEVEDKILLKIYEREFFKK